MEEKWRSSKKEATSFTRSCSTKNSNTLSSSNASPLFMRSSSLKILSSSSSSSKCPDLPRSSSLKNSPPTGSHSNFTSSFSQKGSSITRKAKQQKARFYIMRRCVAMLICWHKHGDP